MISIIMPTKNGSRFISKSIESVLNQNHKDFELIIINDASTDGTGGIIKSWADKDNRIKILTNTESLGTGKSRALGINRSQFPLIALIDDDDLWLDKEKLEKQKKFLEENPEYVLVGSQKIQEIDIDGKLLGYYFNPSSDLEIRNKMLFKDCFITSSMMLKKEAYEKVRGFRDIYRAEDYDLWLRLGKIGKMANIDAEITYRNIKGLKQDHRHLEWYKAIAKAIKDNHQGYPGFWFAYPKALSRYIYFYLFGWLQETWIDELIRKIVRKIF